MNLRESVDRLAAETPLPDSVRPIGLGWEIAPVVGQVADGVTTVIALRKGYKEGNPLMAKVTGDLATFAALKLAIALVRIRSSNSLRLVDTLARRRSLAVFPLPPASYLQA